MKLFSYTPLLIGIALFAAGYPVPKNGQCPSGFRESGGWCAPTTPNAPNAIPKGRDQCPSNWYQSGNYCLENYNPGIHRGKT